MTEQQAASPAGEEFPSAVDSWVVVLLVLLPVISVAAFFYTLVQGGEGALSTLLSLLVIAAIYGGVLFPLYYRLDADSLLIRSGFLRRRVSYATIRAVRPSHNLLSSPALSLNRLRIDFGTGFLSFILISPQRRDEFLTALAARAGLQRDGDSLRRPGL